MIQQLKDWAYRVLLPFEQKTHPLHYDHSVKEQEEAEIDELWHHIQHAPNPRNPKQ